MLAKRPLGQGAASRKYDILTAVGAHALRGSRQEQRSALRFLTLVTARYNWQTDELSVGRAQMAEVWAVDERTVKRELARLKERGWIDVKRPAARGRVAVYRVFWDVILGETETCWHSIGPDFAERLRVQTGRTEPAAQAPKVVAFPRPQPASDSAPVWAAISEELGRSDPGFLETWARKLTFTGAENGVLALKAPSDFVARYLTQYGAEKLLAAAVQVGAGVSSIRIESPQD